MKHLLQASMRLPLQSLSKRYSLSSSLTSVRTHTGALRLKMSTSSSSLTDSVTLASQLGEPVQIIAAPGISDSEFRHVALSPPTFSISFIFFFISKIYNLVS